MLNLARLLRVPHVDNGLRFDISADETRLAFSWNKTGKWEIYELRLDSNDSDSHRLVSKSEGAKFSPRYSSNGSHLAYAVDLDGSESYHIFLHDLKNHQEIDLMPDVGYAHQPNYAFSPDGKSLSILSDETGQFALYLFDLETRKKELLLDVRHPIWEVTWSLDGKWIAAEAESTASDRSIYLISPTTRETIQLNIDNEVLNAQHPAWAPDSKRFVFSAELGEWHHIGMFNIESKEIEWIDQSIGDDTQPAWSRDGNRIGWIHADGAQTSFKVKERSGEMKQYQTGRGVHAFPQFASDNVVILYEDPSHPTDLWKINLANGSFTQLTNSMPDDFDKSEFIQPKEVWYMGKDGTEIPALLYRSENTDEDSPAILNIHGGPNWSFQFLWHPLMSYFASRCWTVLAPNYRGSTGYGKKWQNASRFDMGGVDTDDCAAGVKYLIENKLADKNKIGVTGRSHGGYLTMTCMTMYPELWAAGSAVVPFLNWIKSHYESREDLQHWNIENMGDPEENKQLWIERSPYFYLDKINAPVQMICGANDPRCPASESIDARNKLIELEKEVELLLYQDEGHSFLNTEHLIDSELKRVEFLARFLEKEHSTIA